MTTTISRRSLLEVTVAAIAATVTGNANLNSAKACETTQRKHRVEIKELKYIPEVVQVRPGDIITWINRDIVPHTASAKDNSWDTGLIKSGETRSQIVTAGMSVVYFCRFHPGMTAQLKILLRR